MFFKHFLTEQSFILNNDKVFQLCLTEQSFIFNNNKVKKKKIDRALIIKYFDSNF